jgi:hypothetical protein
LWTDGAQVPESSGADALVGTCVLHERFLRQRKEAINPSDFNDANAQNGKRLGRPDRLKIGATDSRKGRENGFLHLSINDGIAEARLKEER